MSKKINIFKIGNFTPPPMDDETPFEYKFSWRACKEGGQVIGSAEILRPLTKEIYENEPVLYGEPFPTLLSFAEYIKKFPNTYAEYRLNSSGFWELHTVGPLDQYLHEREVKRRMDWVAELDPFSKEGIAFRSVADSELPRYSGKSLKQIHEELLKIDAEYRKEIGESLLIRILLYLDNLIDKSLYHYRKIFKKIR